MIERGKGPSCHGLFQGSVETTGVVFRPGVSCLGPRSEGEFADVVCDT